MASDFTLSEARTRVRNALAARGTKFYTDNEVSIALKDAFRQVCRDTKYYPTYATEDSIEDQGEYGWPSCIFLITQISYEVNDGEEVFPLPKASDHWLANRRTDFRNAESGTPSLYYLLSQTRYGLWPSPDAAGRTIRIDGYGYPVYPGEDDEYLMPSGLGPALISLAASRLAKKDIGGEGGKYAAVYEADYQREKEDWLGIFGPHHDTSVGIDGLASGEFSPHRPLTTLDYGGIITE